MLTEEKWNQIRPAAEAKAKAQMALSDAEGAILPSGVGEELAWRVERERLRIELTLAENALKRSIHIALHATVEYGALYTNAAAP